jgi:hypothetical protein
MSSPRANCLKHEMYAEWLDEDFDPAAFDLAATNTRLEGLR